MKKCRRLRISFVLLVLGVSLMNSCAPSNETAASITFEASASGPFFSGPSSLIAEYDVDLSVVQGLEGLSKDQIKEIKIISVSVNLNEAEELNFEAFSSATLQMVGAETDMQTIAIKNPIDSKTQELILQVSEDADIVEYFKNEKFSLVLDLDFIEDSFTEEAAATINMQLNVKHN